MVGVPDYTDTHKTFESRESTVISLLSCNTSVGRIPKVNGDLNNS